MTDKIFEQVVNNQLALCTKTLLAKGEQYAPGDDRLVHFKVAAGIAGTTPKKALWGMLVKHLTSLQVAVNSSFEYDDDFWNEKIDDSINYLLLLRALAIDEKAEAENE